MTAYDRAKARLPTVNDPLLLTLLEDAQDAILAYTGQKTLPCGLVGAQAQLAVVYYNRLGIEGENSHGEGGVSRSLDMLPRDIEAQLKPYRVAKVVNMTHAPEGS